MNRATLLAEIMQLTREEQEELVENICERLDSADRFAAPSAEQIAEANRRLEEYRRDPSTGLPFEEVMTRLQSRFR